MVIFYRYYPEEMVVLVEEELVLVLWEKTYGAWVTGRV
jgi:hypothetical protein